MADTLKSIEVSPEINAKLIRDFMLFALCRVRFDTPDTENGAKLGLHSIPKDVYDADNAVFMPAPPKRVV